MTEEHEKQNRKPHNYWDEMTPAQKEAWTKKQEESAKMEAMAAEVERLKKIGEDITTYDKIAKTKFILVNDDGDGDNGNGKGKGNGNGNGKGKKDTTVATIKTHFVYKYSKDIPLAEQILLGYKSTFLQIINGEPVTKDVLDFSNERNIILKPHEATNQVVIPYAFKDIEEIKSIIKLAQEKSIYDLFLMSESLWKQLMIAKDEHVITYFAIDTVYSYFQDLFPTTHYTMIIGIPGAGKGAILVSFKLQGYRAVAAAGMTGASLLELLGSDEVCQVTVLEDELQSMDKDPHKEMAYKVGYDDTSQVPKNLDGNTSSRHNEWYLPYDHKILAAEQPPDAKTLGGFNDRTFRIWSLKGKPKYLPKTILHQLRKPEDKRNPKYKNIISKMLFLRKLLLIYRILHHEDIIEEVELNIDGRALELTSPQIYLFSSDKLYSMDKEQDLNNRELVLKKKVLPTLSKFLRDRGELTKKTLEAVVYGALINLIAEIDVKEPTLDIEGDGDDNHENKNQRTQYVVSYDAICDKVKELTDGEDDPHRKQTFTTPDYGDITHNHILDICKNRFSGVRDSVRIKDSTRRVMKFVKEDIEKEGGIFDATTDIKMLDLETEGQQTQEDDDDEDESKVWADWKNQKETDRQQ